MPAWLIWTGHVKQDMRGVLSGWDGMWFLRLAQQGYPSHLDASDAFFPGYPLLVWLVSHLTHDPVVAAVIISLTASLIAMTYIGALARRELPESAAHIAVWVVALFPAAMFLSAAYSDSCFIAAAAASLYYARAGKPWQAAIAAALAGSFRIFGLALIPALAWELWSQGSNPRRWVSLLLAPLGLAGYAMFLYLHTGDALAFAHAEAAFGVHLMAPWQAAWWNFQGLHPASRPIFYAAGAFGIGASILVGLAWVTRLPTSLAIYVTLALLLALSNDNWRSMGRYGLALFPLAIVVARLTITRLVLRRALVAAGGVGLLLTTLTWATGAWVG